MSIILINVPSVAPASVQVWQSDTVDGAKTLVNTFTYSALTTDPTTGKLVLDHVDIDQAKHRWVNYVSTLGESGPQGYLAPVVADPGVGTLTVDLAVWNAVGRQPVEGAQLRVAPYSLPFTDATWVGSKGPWTVKTDANGRASIAVPLNAKLKVTLQHAGVSNIVIENTVPVMNLVDYI